MEWVGEEAQNNQTIYKSNGKPRVGCMQLIETIGFMILKNVLISVCKIYWGITEGEKPLRRL